MSKTLIIMRHAKSGWETPLPDIERPLNPRGRASANALGDWLRAQILVPDELLCSAATRTQETANGLALPVQSKLDRGLYLASSDRLMQAAQGASGDCVLILAHNPGIADFAERLARTPANHSRFFDYPTGATTVFHCKIDSWSELRFGANEITHFVIPREL